MIILKLTNEQAGTLSNALKEYCSHTAENVRRDEIMQQIKKRRYGEAPPLPKTTGLGGAKMG